jgi:ABC-type transport system substrate-binding protein
MPLVAELVRASIPRIAGPIRAWSTQRSTCRGTCRARSTANYGNFEDPEEIDLYDEMLRETDPAKQRALIRDLEKYVLDTEAHEIFLLWITGWFRTGRM